VWGQLVLGAFVLLTAASASLPLFDEAADNAALAARLASVPADAPAKEGAVVRLVGGGAGGDFTQAISRIPGLGPGVITAVSVGVETRPPEAVFTPFLTTPGHDRERARLFGDDDLTRGLVPASRPVVVPPGQSGIWVPAPLARQLAVAPGDRVTVGVSAMIQNPEGDGSKPIVRTAPAVVAGVYRVAPDGRTPADAPGSSRWAYRRAEIPPDSQFGIRPATLLITDVATATFLARSIGDDLFYASEAGLRPAVPTLADAQRTVAGIRRWQADVRDPSFTGVESPLRREHVLSGLPQIVDDATAIAARSVAWTRMAGAAGIALGLVAVLAVAVFGLARRRLELHLAATLGIRPATTGLQAAAEMLPAAVAGAAAGVGVAWVVIGAAGPPGALTGSGLGASVIRAALAAAAGVVLVGVAATVAAARAARLPEADRPIRSVPWEGLLLAVAVTATAGLVARPGDDGEPPSALDLLVPVLVLAAVGAVGARLLLGAIGHRRGPGGSGWRRPVLGLAARRMAAGGPRAVMVITVLTTGLGLLVYSLAAASSVRQVTEDRTAVRAGAAATTSIAASWLLDPGAARGPKPVLDGPPLDDGPVPGARNPPLPTGTTVVWRGRITVPPEYTTLDLLVVDPTAIARAAGWGTGPELARVRALMKTFAAADAKAAAALRAGERATPVPALGMGDVVQRPGESAAVALETAQVPITVLDVVPVFPGAAGGLPTMIVAADSFFTFLGPDDPRLAPAENSGRINYGPRQFYPEVWSRSSAELTAVVTDPDRTVRTLAEAAQEPDVVAARNSTGYLVALGVCVAGLAAVGLALFAERAAARARAADLMLTRLGLGRRRVARARVVELVLYVVIALLLAGLGLAALVPLGARLLDPGGGALPPFVLRVGLGSLLLGLLAGLGGLLLAALAARRRSGLPAEVLRDGE
jgi:hypothetical protein